ncbi:hypothetical protein STIAU_6154 [Stigmatella aurantiaca DW4/3-1]|uniref:Uncharacterized protein n=1 Tax=Stigmatella aurantiaca (strain DW4/3-1) TaxID=378806 RepID=Q09BR7_STIAD|nr:hypothetical protein STIAU_6154 [Stigmatella aurantiaca DW4/3-1]
MAVRSLAVSMKSLMDRSWASGALFVGRGGFPAQAPW